MTNFKKKVATAVVTSTMLLNILAPLAHADTELVISGNGANTTNNVTVNKTGNTTVVQSNYANVTNNVESKASTGNNDANDNIGGDVVISTGNATSNTSVNNDLNKNVADVNNCDCDGDLTVKIADNLVGSTNKVNVTANRDTTVSQNNDAYVHNDVDASSKTGGNDANRNGGGDVTIITGNASTNVTVNTTANVNSAKVGSGNGNGSDASAMIIGNGAWSHNKIKLNLDNDVDIFQSNHARVRNDVDATAKTGYNDANDNIGGDVAILTGNAKANVEVDNNVNFNMAEVGCDCVLDVTAKIADNLVGSHNKIKANLGGDTNVWQGGEKYGNHANLYNDVDGKAKTGGNDANRNGGAHDTDPAIITGNATSDTDVSNSGNVNVFGPAEMPTVHVPGVNFDVHLNFDLHDLLGWLGL